MFGRQGLFGGTLTLGVSRALSQGLGLLQFTYFLYVFGSSVRVDALFVAQTIPVLFTHFLGMPIALLFIPVFLHLRAEEGGEEAWRFTSALIIISTLALGGLMAALILFAPTIVTVLAPGFGPQERLLAAGLLQWLSVLIVVNGLSGAARSLYFAHQSYVVPAVSTVLPSASIIISIYFLSARLGIYSFVVGGIAGSTLQLLVLWSMLNVGERRLRFQFVYWHSALKEFVTLITPRFLILGLSNLNMAVDRAFASTLGVSSISAMGYAVTLNDAPTSWLRTTFGGAIVPVLSDDAAQGDYDSFRNRLQKYLGMAMYLMVPATVILVVLATPLVQTLFQRGNFDARGAQLMAIAVCYYAIGLVPGAMGGTLAAAFFSLKDTMTPFKVSCGLAVLNLVLNFALISSMGLGGLALATSLVAIVRAFFFLYFMKRKVGDFAMQRINNLLARVALSGVAMAAIIAGVGLPLNVFDGSTGPFLERAVPLCVTGALGGATYVLISWLLNVPAATQLSTRVGRIFAKRFASS